MLTKNDNWQGYESDNELNSPQSAIDGESEKNYQEK